jgi:GH25 family lysozyme M1 (1,4-beta-N-acetylmuramidase)
MTRQYELGRGGDSIRSYKPVNNLNRLINELTTKTRYAFPGLTALITQQKKYPDASFYQGPIDFNIMRQKTDAAIFRAGQNLWVDSQFVRNYAEAKKRGMLRGVYFFYDDRISPGAQAQKLAEIIGADLPEMEVWIDWERSYGGQFSGLRNVVAMMQEVERLMPSVTVGMYTGYYWFVEKSNAITNAAQYNYLKDKPLWLAWYAAASVVKVPAPWSRLTLWQYGTPDEYYGQLSIEIDMNFFNGTVEEFYQRYVGMVPTEPGEQMQYRTNQDAKLWRGAGVTQIDTIQEGTLVTGDAPGGEYTRLTIPVGYTRRIWLTPITVTPPPPVEPPVEPPAETDTVSAHVEVDVTATFNGRPYHGLVIVDNLQLRIVE